MEAAYPWGIAGLDFAQITLYAFWIFLVTLIVYCRREDKREGYPLITDPNDKYGAPRLLSGTIPRIPKPKTFLLPDGRTVQVPRQEKVMHDRNYGVDKRARPTDPWPGSPLEPTGDPMKAAIGPGSYAKRDDFPEKTWEGHQKIVPMRKATEFWIDERDPDPRGMPVIGLDGKEAGRVVDVWIDRSEMRWLYLEVEVKGGAVISSLANRSLLPYGFANVKRDKVTVASITAAQFADVPGLKDAEQITPQEEDMICAYYGGGTLYAVEGRTEPFLP